LEVKKIEQRSDFRSLNLEIDMNKMYHEMFHRYLPKEVYDKLFPPQPAPPTPIKPSKHDNK
jgi:hypothetical protein